MFAEDLTHFFDLQGFAVSATLAGEAVRGVFDNGSSLGNVGIGMAGTQPAFTLATASIVGEAVGQALVIGSASYLVAVHEPDGTGVSRLVLEAA